MIELPEMVTVPAGRFHLGAVPDDRFANATELPVREVVIERPFAVARFPVTESQWRSYAQTGPSSGLPVVRVSWHEAVAYTVWLRQQTGRPYRLLTEAEWEYSCRAGTRSIFATGDDITPSQANYWYDEHGFKVGRGHRTPTGTYVPNAFGIEDMHGNVCEWTDDAWRHGPVADTGAYARVIRGGAWDYLPRLLRCSWRDSALPDTRRDNLGFRMACDL